MPQVAVMINGKTYRMACEDGQEAHLLELAKTLDGHVSDLKGSFGEIGDQRLTVMAGIMMVDEVFELKKNIQRLENEVAALQTAQSATLSDSAAKEQQVAKNLTRVAERLKDMSGKITEKAKAKPE
jgi:cell division protein ZapA